MDYGRCRFIEKWPGWDNSIHEDEAQISRQGWAMTYPFTFEVDYKTKTAQFSSTTDIPYYETSLAQCNCYDFQSRNLPCKHMYRLAVELGIIKIIKRNSGELLAEIKTLDDIDGHPEQQKRIESAKKIKNSSISINYENKTAVFIGSGKNPYKTTLNSCTCGDYLRRRLPCKHIYRLRRELEEKQ